MMGRGFFQVVFARYGMNILDIMQKLFNCVRTDFEEVFDVVPNMGTGVGAITSIDGMIWVTKQDCMDLISWC